MQKQVDESRAAGADIVVLLSHNGFDVDHKLAGRVKGLDVILTAHTHDAMPGLMQASAIPRWWRRARTANSSRASISR